MTQSKNKAVSIAPKSAKTVLSAAQKRFNSLTRKIDKEKKLLLEWKETIPLYQQKLREEYEPLDIIYNTHRAELVRILDQHYDNKLFKKTDKAKIQYLICTISIELIIDYDMDELKPIFNKHSEDDFDEIAQESGSAITDMMKNLAESMLNVKIDDDVDVSTPEKFHAHLKAKLDERENKQSSAPVKERKKTKKQLEKEAREQEEAKQISKSVQEVYRKLVSVLHPDREQDEQERERKNELMQRVNTAYGKKDLLQLLALQLEIEQIDPEHLSNIADSRLKHFNKILDEQLAELEQENAQIESFFKMNLNEPFYYSLTPTRLLSMVQTDILTVKTEIESIKLEVEDFQNPAAFKAWLKTYKIPKDRFEDDFDDLFMTDLFR